MAGLWTCRNSKNTTRIDIFIRSVFLRPASRRLGRKMQDINDRMQPADCIRS